MPRRMDVYINTFFISMSSIIYKNKIVFICGYLIFLFVSDAYRRVGLSWDVDCPVGRLL